MPVTPDVLFLNAAIAASPLTPNMNLIDKKERLAATEKGLKRWINAVPSHVVIILVENTGYGEYFRNLYGHRVHVIDAPAPTSELVSKGKAACFTEQALFALDNWPICGLPSSTILIANAKNFIPNYNFLLKRLPSNAKNAIWFIGNLHYIDLSFYMMEFELFNDFLHRCKEIYQGTDFNEIYYSVGNFDNEKFMPIFLSESKETISIFNHAPIRDGLSGTWNVKTHFFSEKRFIYFAARFHYLIRRVLNKSFEDSRYN
jgi:hypothetical protein